MSTNAAKIFKGDRTIDGLSVTVNGADLARRDNLRQFDDGGFEWSYEGDGPRQLALAILAEHLDDDQQALMLTEIFMARIVANFDNEWELSSTDIETALDNMRPKA